MSQPVIPSIDGYLGWIVTGGIITILVTVWRAAVRIERRIGDLGKEIKVLEGDKKVLDERASNVKDNIDKIDSRLREIEKLVWEAAPWRAKRIREKIREDEEKEEKEEREAS
jgi:hypothetical protein